MLTDEEKLLGWLCIVRLNLGHDKEPFNIPRPVRLALRQRGWIECTDEHQSPAHVTELGRRVTDLAAPEWGIDPIGVEV